MPGPLVSLYLCRLGLWGSGWAPCCLVSGSSGILTGETKALDSGISAIVGKSGSLANVMTGTQATGDVTLASGTQGRRNLPLFPRMGRTWRRGQAKSSKEAAEIKVWWRKLGRVLRACGQSPVCLVCAWGPCPAWTCPPTPLYRWAAVLANMFAWLQLWYNMTL